MKYTLSISSARIALAVCACFLWSAAAGGQEQVNPINVNMIRYHASTYVPGQQLEIQITMTADGGSEGINAVGLRENIPVGWTYLGLGGATGAAPAVQPQPGAEQLLEFAWIEIPQLPYSFTYSIGVPESDPGGNQVIHGQFEYRLDGPALFGPPVITTLNGIDKQPPTIRLNGSPNVTIQQGQGWSDPGATARDNVDGDISGSIQISGDVNVNVPGSYAVTYTSVDSSGNSASATRVVTVVAATDTGGGTGGTPTTGGNTGGGGVSTGGGGTVVGRDYGGGGLTSGQRAADAKKQAQNAGDLQGKRAPTQMAQGTAAAAGGNKQLRPGVDPSEGITPAPGIIISKNAAAEQTATTVTPGDHTVRPQGALPGPEPGGTPAAAPVAEKHGKELSDAWPDAPEEVELAQVQPVATGSEDQTAASGALAKQRVAVLPIAVIAVVGVVALGVIFFVSRSVVYGGQRRRKPARPAE
ncbi:MAG: DUF5011 domain-containing protein [Candidatus Hydrogenedens sp.]|nr:DUF5011 domain-containing protein [Candidatus Hydrogenedens sp.]